MIALEHVMNGKTFEKHLGDTRFNVPYSNVSINTTPSNCAVFPPLQRKTSPKQAFGNTYV